MTAREELQALEEERIDIMVKGDERDWPRLNAIRKRQEELKYIINPDRDKQRADIIRICRGLKEAVEAEAEAGNWELYETLRHEWEHYGRTLADL